MKRKIVILSAIFITFLVMNMDAANITENTIVDTALTNNPGLIAYEKMKKAAEADAWKSFWPDNPKIGMENMGGSGGLFSSGVKKLNISRKIPSPLTYVFNAGAAVENTNMADSVYMQKKWQTASETRIAYYEYYKLSRIIRIMEETVELVKQFTRIVSSKYATGNASQQDVLKADVEYAR